MKSIERILVRSPNWIGDHVMARAFYESLRSHYPTAALTLLASPQVAGLKLGQFDSQLELPLAWRRLSEMKALARRLRQMDFQLALSLPASWSSNLLLWLAGIPQRIGFDAGGSGIFLTEAVKWRGSGAGRHKSAQYLDLIRLLDPGGSLAPESLSEPGPRASKLIVIAPGAAIGLREWPYFPQLLKEIARRWPGYRIVLVGGPGESKWHARVARLGLGQIEDLIGKTDLEALRRWCSDAELVIANDSGVAHVAASVAEARTLVLYGPGNPAYIRPCGGRSVDLFRSDLPCRPCDSNHCAASFGYQVCLRGLPVEQVLQAVDRIVSGKTSQTT